jgi:hypothetical protein
VTEGGPALLDELGGPARPLSLLELAHVVGSLRWVELQAFARLGGEATSGALPPPLAVWASSASLAHAWRADQLLSLLPASTGLPSPEECTTAGGPAVEAFVGRLRAASASTATAAWYAELASAYERRAEFAHPAADGAAARTFVRLAADIRSGPLAGPSRAPVTPAAVREA